MHALSQRSHGFFAVDDGLDLLRHRAQIIQDGFNFIGKHVPAQLRQVQTQDISRGNLRQESLGGSHSDFRTSVGIKRCISLTWDGCALGITNRNNLRTLLAGMAHRHERVHGLTRLRQRDH